MIFCILITTNMGINILLFLLLINSEQSKSVLLRGERAQDGQFPWLIQFQTIAPCGGVLISSDWVLTAAQCVQDKRNSIVLFATGLNGTDTKQTVSVKATYIHPHYEPYSVLPDRDYNIALMKLNKSFDMCNSKIILPNIPVKYDTNYAPCLIFGWQSYVSSFSKVLAKPIQYSEVILSSWKLCTYMIKTSTNYTNVFCTMVEFKDEMKACAGNPGSPVVCENQHHETALLGIASWTNFSLECGDLPTYVDLDAFRTWIKELIFNDKEVENWKDNHRSNENNCKFKENTNVDNLRNNTNFLRINSQINDWPINAKIGTQTATSMEHKNRSFIWSRLYIPISHKFKYINVTSFRPNNLSHTHTVDKAISTNHYKEIGKTKDSCNNQTITNLKKGQLSLSNKSRLCNSKKRDKIIKKHNNDHVESTHFEYLLPLYFEEITTSHSRIIVAHSRSLYFLSFIFLSLHHYLHVIYFI
nr:PREDICTED: mite allergen Der p 3-like [Megachile rotundata]